MSEKLDIIRFLSEFSLNGRSISRKLQVSPQTALNILDDLCSSGLVRTSKVGRNTMYSLEKSFHAIQYLVLAEMKKSLTIAKELQPLFFDLQGLYDTILLYGSFAKGTYTKKSDVDLLFIGSVSDKIKDVIAIFPRQVQYECVSWDEFSSSQGHLFVEMKKNHIIFGNVLGVVTVFTQGGMV